MAKKKKLNAVVRGIGRYGLNVLISVDQLANALRLGDPDETISSRLGKLKLRNKGKIPWKKPLSKLLDKILDKIDPGHSLDAIEFDEGKDAIGKPRDRLHVCWTCKHFYFVAYDGKMAPCTHPKTEKLIQQLWMLPRERCFEWQLNDAIR